MEAKKPDKRTLRTRRAITNSFAELMAQKELRNITVQEIADNADVNRVTFYKHYYDIYDLYEQTEKSVFSELGSLILSYKDNRAEDFAEGMTDYIAENPKIFRMIFSTHNTGRLRAKLVKMIEGLFRLIQSEENGCDLNDYRLNYYCGYQANGCIAIFEKWVNDNLAQPKEFIIRTITEFNRCTDELIASQFSTK